MIRYPVLPLITLKEGKMREESIEALEVKHNQLLVEILADAARKMGGGWFQMSARMILQWHMWDLRLLWADTEEDQKTCAEGCISAQNMNERFMELHLREQS